jgi:hypothetical protein
LATIRITHQRQLKLPKNDNHGRPSRSAVERPKNGH